MSPACLGASGARSKVSSLATNAVDMSNPLAQAAKWLTHGRVNRCHLRVLMPPMLLGIVVMDS